MSRISKGRRFKILTRDSFTCRYCGRSAPSVELHVDHVHPVSKGGSNRDTNLVTACVDCNAGKRDKILPRVAPAVVVAAAPAPEPRPIAAAIETVPHPDRCRGCFGNRLYPAYDEAPIDRGFVAFYRCDLGHTWKTHWSNDPANRLTTSELLEVVS